MPIQCFSRITNDPPCHMFYVLKFSVNFMAKWWGRTSDFKVLEENQLISARAGIYKVRNFVPRTSCLSDIKKTILLGWRLWSTYAGEEFYEKSCIYFFSDVKGNGVENLTFLAGFTSLIFQFSKHPLHSTSECFNFSVSDRDCHKDIENVWRISVLVSLWHFSRDFILPMIFLKFWMNFLYSVWNFTKLNSLCTVEIHVSPPYSLILFHSLQSSSVFLSFTHRIENTTTLATPHAKGSIIDILTLNTK